MTTMDINQIRHALDKLPTLRESNLPELVRFFKNSNDLMRFLSTFAGSTFVVPNPRLLRSVERDIKIAMDLRRALTPVECIELCRKHQVSYRHLEVIYEATEGRKLHHPAHNGTSAGRQLAALETMSLAKPGNDDLIREMYDLSEPQLKAVRLKFAAKKDRA